MKTFIFVFLSALLNLFLAGQVFAHDVNQHQIAAAMKKIFDKPEAPLSVPSISVEGDYAVAGWVQGERGGRAFLQKLNGHWIIKACAGSALTQGESIQSLGMDTSTLSGVRWPAAR